MDDDSLPKVSVIFISYNRAHTLVAAYETFLAFTDYPRDRLELVLADDASNAATRAVLEAIPFDKRAVAKRNAGLGANMNRGIDAATGEYLLVLQDDWMLVGRGDYLKVGVQALRSNDDIGMILYRDRPELPTRDRRPVGSDTLNLLRTANPDIDTLRVGESAYSDNPHLKRRDFHAVVGRYAEGVPMTRMELEMSRAVASQDRYAVATIDGMEVFRHIGDRFTFNPGNRLARRIERVEAIPGGRYLTGAARAMTRLVKGRRKPR